MKDNSKVVIVVAGNQGQVPEFSPIENLRWSIQDNGSFRKVSDINLLQNMDRIRKYLGEDTYRAIVISMSKSASRPSVSKDNLTDVQLLDTTMSRYMQSSSERRAIIMDLTRRYQGLIDKATEIAHKDSESSNSTSSDTSSSSSSSNTD